MHKLGEYWKEEGENAGSLAFVCWREAAGPRQGLASSIKSYQSQQVHPSGSHLLHHKCENRDVCYDDWASGKGQPLAVKEKELTKILLHQTTYERGDKGPWHTGLPFNLSIILPHKPLTHSLRLYLPNCSIEKPSRDIQHGTTKETQFAVHFHAPSNSQGL